MRRAFEAVIGLLLSLSIVACGSQSEEELNQQLSNLYQQEKYAGALAVADQIIEEYGPAAKAVNSKYRILLELEDYEGALETFEIILEQVGETPDVAIDKVRLLGKLGRNEEALEYALAVEEKSSEKSAYLSSYICKFYVSEGEKESALEWMAVSLERGDYGFEYYLGDDFALLHEEPQFLTIIQEMRQATGIGLPAKDFSGPLGALPVSLNSLALRNSTKN
jgi:tetratricopeptide (TPR) repeat protein